MDGSLFIQYRPTKRTGKLKTRPGIKLRTFPSILLRTGILPLLVLRSGSITFSFVPPQHNTLFVFRGTRLFSLVVIYTDIDFYYLQVSFPLLFFKVSVKYRLLYFPTEYPFDFRGLGFSVRYPSQM